MAVGFTVARSSMKMPPYVAKALGPRLLVADVLALAAFIPVLTAMTVAALKRQES